jgi:hypothetical protein
MQPVAASAPTSDYAPSTQVAMKYADHFTALGVSDVQVSGVDKVTLNYTGKQNGLEYALATASVRDTVDGVKLLWNLEQGTQVPRLLVHAGAMKPLYQALPGVTNVDMHTPVSPQLPPRSEVYVHTADEASAALLRSLMKDRLPDGSSVSFAPGEG